MEGYRDSKSIYKHHNTECPDKTATAEQVPECRFRCSEDGDCPEFQYCCPNGCGRVCVPPKMKTAPEDCGCSVTFLSTGSTYYEYYDTFDSNSKSGPILRDIAILGLVWESLKDIFTPSMEPYVTDSYVDDALLGRFESLCQLRNAISKGFAEGNYVSYDLYKKKTRKLFIIADTNKDIESVVNQHLKGAYTTVCLITVGNVTVPEALTNQLTQILSEPCHWSVDSIDNLGNISSHIKLIVNDGTCACPDDSGIFTPCATEGDPCTIDEDCEQPALLCDRGLCRKSSCHEPDVINHEVDPRHEIEPILDYPVYQFFSYKNTYYYHAYDYFLDYMEDGNFDYMYDDFDIIPFSPGYYEEIAEGYFPKTRNVSVRSGHNEYDEGGLSQEDAEKIYNKRNPEYARPNQGCCHVDYFTCPGMPTLCVMSNKVCDGMADCPHAYDETSEACAKRICGRGHFQCASGECIFETQVCDGHKDCPDGSDEYCNNHDDCPTYRQHNCLSGECISHDKICNGQIDCESGEDEIKCKCDGFKCKSGGCEDTYTECDGYANCKDSSDEHCIDDPCPKGTTFKCADGKCLYNYQVCDGWDDCTDGADENPAMCSPEDCFYCSDGKCISKSLQCNGYDDCEDGADETDCEFFVCKKHKFKCDSGECLRKILVWNGREECADGSDEKYCPISECPDIRPLKCSSGECIGHSQVCDGIYNCADRSDESKCLDMSCPTNRNYTCQSGQCLYSYIVPNCDGYKDCIDGSDEMNCESECSLKCRSGGCYFEDDICDGYRFCSDGTDEENCEGLPCSTEKQLRCNSGECLSKLMWCDGDHDCRDGSDETDCDDFACAKSRFKCDSGECVAKRFRCDGYTVNCKDASDEKGCNPKKHCLQKVTPTCNSGECLEGFKFCDGYNQCLDSSDEEKCENFKCPSYRPFKCGSGECRANFYRCDGFVNCADGSDEKDCGTYTCPPRRPYKCPNYTCITYYQVCNGFDDCGDGSDEMECDTFTCPSEYFQCKAGNCISKRLVCNYVPDCPDGDDEKKCNKD